jgi:NitT/TauT family transport system substrate-binding protein
MFSRRARIAGLICLTAFLYAGLAGWAFAAPQEIRFGYLAADQLHSPAVMVMKEKKLLEAAGLTVKWREFLAGTYAMQDLAWGSIDFASCGAVPIMTAHAQDVKLAVLAGSNTEGSSLVVHTSITTIKELDGKIVATPGIGSIQDALLTQLTRTHAIRIRRVAMKVSDMPLFLQKKEIDGFLAWAPHPARTVAHMFGRELLTSHDILPGHQCCALVTRENLLRDNPETVNTLLRVYLDAYRWFLDNQDESVRLLAKNTGMTEDIIRQALKTVHYPYPAYCNVASMRSMAQDLVSTGRITTVKEADLASFIESLYRPELLEKFSGAKQPGL